MRAWTGAHYANCGYTYYGYTYYGYTYYGHTYYGYTYDAHITHCADSTHCTTATPTMTKARDASLRRALGRVYLQQPGASTGSRAIASIAIV